MNNLTLNEWFALAEALAVVFSLPIVAYSVYRNNAVLRAVNDNFLYQLQDARHSDIVRDPSLVSIFLKQSDNSTLSAYEKQRFIKHQMRGRNIWELAFDRHNEGLFPSNKWKDWNRMFATDKSEVFPEKWWAEVKGNYGEKFVKHVDAQ